MSKSVNKVFLVGNVGKAVELKYTTGGTAVAKFSLACTESFKQKDGTWTERTEWVSVTAWEKLAEIIGKFVTKGSKLYIEGRLQTSSWDDKQTGDKKYKTEVVASEVIFLDGKNQQQQQEQTEEDVPF
jgi:single-strand DNA-binding protein